MLETPGCKWRSEDRFAFGLFFGAGKMNRRRFADTGNKSHPRGKRTMRPCRSVDRSVSRCPFQMYPYRIGRVSGWPREGVTSERSVPGILRPVDYRLALVNGRGTDRHAPSGITRGGCASTDDVCCSTRRPGAQRLPKTSCLCISRQHLEQAAASEKLARKRLADATLCSPVSGFVSKRSVEPGQMASSGQTAFEIVKLDTVEVNVGVPETDIHLVRVGQKAVVTLPALPGESSWGSCAFIHCFRRSPDPHLHDAHQRPRTREQAPASAVAESPDSRRRHGVEPPPIETVVRVPWRYMAMSTFR